MATFSLASAANAGIDETYVRPGEGWGKEIFQKIFGQKIFGKSYAVVVGVGKYNYHNLFPNLDGPTQDALRVSEFMKADAQFDYVVTITDEQATKIRIEHLMEVTLPALIQPGDRFLFYFSGHGVTRTLPDTRVRGYLAVSNSSADWDSMIDMSNIVAWSDNVSAARHVLFLLDACFSGLAAYQIKSNNATSQTIERLEQPARHVVTAGVDTEESYIYNGSSIFTDTFLKAARGQYGRVTNGVISLSEIMDDVNRAIDQKRADLGPVVKMTPHMYETGIENNSGEFFFLVDPTTQSSKSPPTPSRAPKPGVSAKSSSSLPAVPLLGSSFTQMCADQWRAATAAQTVGEPWVEFIAKCRSKYVAGNRR